MTNQNTKDKAEGTFHEVKGAIKSKVGELTNYSGLETEGVVEKIAGKIQKKIGQVEEVIEKP
ncbi:MAG: CsbD family protein [Candidatus Acidiferrales bacterium]